MADAEADQGCSPSPLVTVSFQKNEQRKLKFLDGEPKALGITQMTISIFHISCIGSLYAADLINTGLEVPSFIASLLIFIAGALAVTAKNLHLPTLRACLGMEVVASIAALFNGIITLIKTHDLWRLSYYCYHYEYSTVESQLRQNCHSVEAAYSRLFSELVVMHVAMFAISVTLTVYTAKVVNCCAPGPKVPVITIQAPPAPQ